MASNSESAPTRDRPRELEEDMEPPESSERTPLLTRAQSSNDQSQPQRDNSAEAVLRGLSRGKSGRRRWPSLLALIILCLVAILIMVFAFFAPSIVEQYATQAVVFEPTSLSIDSFTASGVRARIQGNFMMDASRVQKKPVRDLGIFGTWVAREAETKQSEIEVSLPEFGNVVLGVAHVPGVKVNIQNGHRTHVDVLSDLEPGDKEGLRTIANSWIDGRLGQLRVVGKAKVPLKSGLFYLGTQQVQHEMVFDNNDIPSLPAYEIKSLLFRDADVPYGKAMEADLSLLLANSYPVDFTIPQLGFQILVEDCVKSDPYIQVAQAITEAVHIRPKEDVELNVTGYARQLASNLTQDCPGSTESPLDVLLGNYMHGKENIVYVRGAEAPSGNTPGWVGDLISGITVPVPLPGRTFGHLIKNFTLADTHFTLPDPWAEPNTPESNPRISAKVRALVALPEEMNLDIDAQRVRADADVFYEGSKLGKLDLGAWQHANSSRVNGSQDDGPGLMVESLVDKAPLIITDDDVFTKVIQELVWGSKSVLMHVKAVVDVQVATALGEFKIRRIPAEGKVPVKPISPPPPDGSAPPSFSDLLKPRLTSLVVTNTTAKSLTLAARLNLTNPTPYGATIPFLDLRVWKNGSVLAHAWAEELVVQPGLNVGLRVGLEWAPDELDGDGSGSEDDGRAAAEEVERGAGGGGKARAVGRELLSRFISGYGNVTVTVRMHAGSIPALPRLGAKLGRRFAVEVEAPRLRVPGRDGDGDGDEDEERDHHYIRDATFHLLSSSADFTLLSPLRANTLMVNWLNATAFYREEDNGDGVDDDDDDDDDDGTEDEVVGRIYYDVPFAVPPVDGHGNGVTTPRLPVDWRLGGVGYEAVRRALGGRLKLAAFAWVGVGVGEWRETVWYRGRGIGAAVRL